MKNTLLLFLMSGALLATAQVRIVNSPLPLDGNPDGNGWKEVPEQSGFKMLKASGKTNPAAQTSFKAAADAAICI